MSVLDPATNPRLLSTLHTRAVLVALNSGLREGRPTVRAPLAMFHDDDPRGRDFMLADAIRGTPLWGAYLTDFFKGVPTRDGSGLADHLVQHPGLETASASTLRRELADLGATRPLLVCLGRQVEPFVRAPFGADHDVVRVSHYSRAMTKTAYRQEFSALPRRTTE